MHDPRKAAAVTAEEGLNLGGLTPLTRRLPPEQEQLRAHLGSPELARQWERIKPRVAHRRGAVRLPVIAEQLGIPEDSDAAGVDGEAFLRLLTMNVGAANRRARRGDRRRERREKCGDSQCERDGEAMRNHRAGALKGQPVAAVPVT